MIPVTQMEYEILEAISNGCDTLKKILERVGYYYSLLQSRCYYFATQKYVRHEDKKFLPNYSLNRFYIEHDAKVLSVRNATNRQKDSEFDTKHIPDFIKDEIKILVMKGLKRTQIAKMLGIKKCDLLMVICEKNIRSPINEIDLEAEDESREVHAKMVQQYKDAYLLSKKMAKERDYPTIANLLNSKGYTNMQGNKFVGSMVRKLVVDPPKIILGVLNDERTHQNVIESC